MKQARQGSLMFRVALGCAAMLTMAGGASAADAASLAADGASPGEDIHADRAFREHLARVLTRRALEHLS